jgi:6-phosphofructokinase 1
MKMLTVVSGGDAPGINAALGQIIQSASDGQVLGCIGGLPGLVQGHWKRLRGEDVRPFVGLGGSLLPSSREPILKDPSAQADARQKLHEAQITGIVLFGGDGTLRHVLPILASWGVPCAAIPTTIDNDVPGTDYTLGFDSACNFAYHSIDGVTATAHALSGRVFMVETLGGSTGYLALAVAAGAGAHAVLLPEYDYDELQVASRLRAAADADGFALLVLSEGAKGARTLAETLPERIGMRVRDVRLGHAQRGGPPTHRDRVFARQAAELAVETLADGCSGVIVERGGVLQCVETLPNERPLPDAALYRRINGL